MRDLNNYKELQAYCKHLGNEMEKLNYAEQVDMTIKIQCKMYQKGYNKYSSKKFNLQLNKPKQYLMDWIEVVIDSSYEVKVNDKIDWF